METLARGLAFLYIFVVPWEKLIIIPGLGTGLRIVGFGAIGATALVVVARGSVRKFHSLHAALFALSAYFALSSIWATSARFAAVRTQTLLINLLLVIVVNEVLNDRRDFVLAFRVYIYGCYIAVIGITFRVLTGNVSQFQRRATLANTDENTVALVLAVGLPLAWYLATNANVSRLVRNREKWLMFAYIPAAYLGILFTASRGGAVGSLPFLFSIPFAIRSISPRQRGLTIAGLVGVVVAAGASAPDTSWQRIFETGDQISSGDISSRVIVWEAGINLWLESPFSLLFGVGHGNYQFLVGKVSHNTPLAILVEGGLVGLLITAAVFAVLLQTVLRMAHGARLLWLTAFAIWGIAGLSLTLQWSKVTWAMFAMLIMHARLQASQASTDDSTIDPSRQPVGVTR